jgi:hypothetical protein
LRAGDPSQRRVQDFWPRPDGFWFNDYESASPSSVPDPAPLLHGGVASAAAEAAGNASVAAWLLTGGNGAGGPGGPGGLGLLPFDPSWPAILSPLGGGSGGGGGAAAGAAGASPGGDARVMVGVGAVNGRWAHGANYRHTPGLAFSRGSQHPSHAFAAGAASSLGPQPGRWYKLDVFLDWHNSTYKLRLDDVTVALDMPFAGEGVTRVGLYVFDRSTAWFDELFAGPDDTLAFECPHTSAERAALSMRRPVQSAWGADEVGAETVLWPTVRHENHLSRRETYTNPYHAGLAFGDGEPHRWYHADVGNRAGAAVAFGVPPQANKSQTELPGEVLAGALLAVRGDQPAPSLLEAAQTLGALADTNRAQLPRAYVSASDPFAPPPAAPLRTPLYAAQPLDQPAGGDQLGLGLGAASQSGWPPFGEWSGPQERFDSAAADPSGDASLGWRGDLFRVGDPAAAGPFASARAGVPPFGEWTGGESVRSGGTAERGPEGGYRGATGRTYWYGEHDCE